MGGSTDVDKRSSGLVLKGLSPPRRASLVTAGSGARRKAQGFPFHLGATGKGKTGRVNCVNLR
jgi:hypothetical protein